MPSAAPKRFKGGVSLGTKLFFVFFAGIVAFVSIVGFLSYRISENIITKQARSSFQQTIDKTGQNGDLIFGNIVNASKKLSLDAAFTQAVDSFSHTDDLGERTAQMARIMDALRTAKADSPLISSISVLYDGGGVMSEGKGVAADAYRAVWIAPALQANGQPIWLSSPGGETGFVKTNDHYKAEPAILLARLLRNAKTGEDLGVVAIEVELKALADSLGGIDGAALSIVDGQGNFVYDEDAAMLAQPSGFGAVAGAAKTIGGAGGKRLLAGYSLAGTDWTLTGTVPLGTLTKDTVRIAQVTGIAAIAAALFAALVGWAVVAWIAKPVGRLTELMAKAAAGDLTGRAAPTKRKDEVGRLSRHFNEMMIETGRLIAETVEAAASLFETAAAVEAASGRTAASAGRIAESSRGMADGALSLAADAERGVVLAERMMADVDDVVRTAGDMGERADEARRVGEEGQRHLRTLSEATSVVESANRGINARMAALSSQTDSVTLLLDQLNRLARQTNILSLNAAIEASRVGAAGKGFQVIAMEMGNLAKESEHHIGRAADWMQAMTADIQGTTAEMNRAAPLFGQQFQAIVRTERLFGDIGERMGGFMESLRLAGGKIAQMAATQQSMLETIVGVGAVSEQSTASVQEVAAMTGEQAEIGARLVGHARQLAEWSERLKSLLVRFRV